MHHRPAKIVAPPDINTIDAESRTARLSRTMLGYGPSLFVNNYFERQELDSKFLTSVAKSNRIRYTVKDRV
jgi:hypothetical protein